MRHRPLILSLLLLSLSALPLRAQWSGSADLAAGLGGMNGDREREVGFLGHILTQGDLGLDYKSDKFTWTTSVKGKWEPKSSDNSRLNFSRSGDDRLDVDLVYKTVKTRPLELSVRSDFGWKPSQDRNYSAWISYKYGNDKARNVSNSLSGTMHMDGSQARHYYESPREFVDGLTLDDMDSHLASCYFEVPRQNGHTLGVGAKGEWRLGSKSLLQGSFSVSTNSSRRHTTWSVFKTSGSVPDDIDVIDAFREGNAWLYRITPNTFALDYTADVHFQRTVRDDGVSIRWTPGVRVLGNRSLDHNSGSSLSDIRPDGSYVWKDSLRLRENFDFISLVTEPYVKAEYRGKKVEISADYAASFYFCRLSDDERSDPLSLVSVYPVGNARLAWDISENHRLVVTHQVSAEYPDFLKVCWYDRTGGYADQLFRGNSDLISSQSSRYGFNYELKHKYFRYTTANDVTRTLNEIDRTWFNEEIEGRLYKVFHWVNADDSWAFGTAHRLGWEGRWLKAGTGVEFKMARRVAKSDGTVKDASGWVLSADAEASLGKGWTVSADTEYRSKTATFFTSSDEYWDLGVRVKKTFRDVTLYFDGRDLLDHSRRTTFESTEGEKFWVDIARENRRLFLLGFKWNF